MKISFIIPSYNNWSGIHRCIQSIEKQSVFGCSSTFELIIALDMRDHEFIEHVAHCRICKPSFIVRAKGPGVNAARNAGILKATGEIYAFIDDDCFLPDEKWLSRLCDLIKRFPEAKGYGGKYLSDVKLGLIEQCRNVLSNQFLMIHTDADNKSSVLLGGASVYKKDVFSGNGYFDETILYGSAETEFNHRVVKKGGYFYCHDDLSLFHHPSPQKKGAFIQKAFFQGIGYAYSLKKNNPVKGTYKRMSCLRMARNISRPRVQKMGAFFIIIILMVVFKLGMYRQKWATVVVL